MKVYRAKDNNGKVAAVSPWWPVGSIYLSVKDINPSEYFGGTWEQIAKGRTLVGVDTNDIDFNTVKKTGGEKNHTLTINEMPSHKHSFKGLPNYGTPITWGTLDEGISYAYTNETIYERNTAMLNAGGNHPHNNLQPYFTCYIWLRTA